MPRIPVDAVYADTSAMRPVQADAGAVSPGLASAGFRQMEQLGQTISQSGTVMLDIATSMQNYVDSIQVTDALNQVRQRMLDLTYGDEGYANLRGGAALNRPDGRLLPEEYGGRLDAAVSEIGSGLHNENQRQAFARRSSDLVFSFRGATEKHLHEQFRDHSLSVLDNAIKLGQDEATRNWQDETKIDTELSGVKAAVVRAGQLRGESANEITEKMLIATSMVHTSVLNQMMIDGDPLRARAYLNQRKGEMTADDILKAGKAINHDLDTWIVGSVVQQTAREMTPRFQSRDLDRLNTIVIGMESNGRDYAPDGSVLTSPKGAKGRNQVLDSTNYDPGFGVRPAQNDSLEERARVGRDYLAAMVQKYGELPKALAAYNAGPGAVDAAVKDKGDAWISAMPEETKQYVRKGIDRYSAGEGAAERPSEQEFVQRGLEKLSANARPEQIRMARTQLEHQYGLIEKARKQQADQVLSEAQRALVQNGGDFNALDPVMKMRMLQADPDIYKKGMDFAKAVSRGESKSDPELYAKLAAYPGELAKLTDAQFVQLRTQLSDADYKHFARERGELMTGKRTDTAESIDSASVNQVLGNRLMAIGINPKPSAKDTEGMQRVGSIQKYVRDHIFELQKNTGKALTEAEIEQSIDRLFTKDVTFRAGFLFTRDASKKMLSMSVKDLSSQERDSLRARFAAVGVLEPTDDQLIRAYWTQKNGR